MNDDEAADAAYINYQNPYNEYEIITNKPDPTDFNVIDMCDDYDEVRQ